MECRHGLRLPVNRAEVVCACPSFGAKVPMTLNFNDPDKIHCLEGDILHLYTVYLIDAQQIDYSFCQHQCVCVCMCVRYTLFFVKIAKNC